MPVLGACENAEETANLCLRLFSASRAKEVSIVNINTEHSFPARKASNKPNGIVCKLTRRLERDKVVATRKQVAMVQLGHLGFLEDISLKYLAIYYHLSPRLQSLLHDANKFKVKERVLILLVKEWLRLPAKVGHQSSDNLALKI